MQKLKLTPAAVRLVFLRLCLYSVCAFAGVFISAFGLIAPYFPSFVGNGEVLLGIDASNASQAEKETQKEEVIKRSIQPMTKQIYTYNVAGAAIGLMIGLLIDLKSKSKTK